MTTDVVLVVVADPGARRAAAECLAGDAREIHESPPEDGLVTVVRAAPDLIIAEADQGLELLRVVNSRGVDADAILLDGTASGSVWREARQLGAFDVLPRPVDAPTLRTTANAALRSRRIRRNAPPTAEPTDPRMGAGALVGSSSAMEEVRRRIWTYASTRLHVLVRGETGTGKELVARALHACSEVPGEPFVAVNVTTLGRDLAESTLFGHVQGAYTGATDDRRGAFELAGRGTLLLDEIGSLSLELQPKLLRVLDDGGFTPVGAGAPRRSEARVVAATNEDLEQKVEEGRFRLDLLHRLKNVEIWTPPLRVRMEDVLELAEHFLREMAAEQRLSRCVCFSPEARSGLLGHSWEGNVRELRNVVRRAFARQRGGVILVEDLELTRSRGGGNLGGVCEGIAEASEVADARDSVRADPSAHTFAEIQRAYLISTLEKCNANQSEAARRLAMPRSTFQDLMKRLGIRREDYDPRYRSQDEEEE